MPLYWGVDSVTPANYQVITPPEFIANGEPRHQTLFEYVTRRAGRTPDFWGRYLNNYRSAISHEESEFIFSRSNGRCRILLVYNGPYRSGVTDLTGGQAFQNGIRSAQTAVQIARTLGVPRGTRIYADLERWFTDASWFRGWFEEMNRSEYAGLGGIYGNVGLHQAHGQGFQDSLSQATPDAVDQNFNDFIRSLAVGGNPRSSIAYIWSNRPYLTVNHDLPPSALIPTSFSPNVGHADFGAETVLWQYAANVPLYSGHPYVDLNLATDNGYSDMWSR